MYVENSMMCQKPIITNNLVLQCSRIYKQNTLSIVLLYRSNEQSEIEIRNTIYNSNESIKYSRINLTKDV